MKTWVIHFLILFAAGAEAAAAGLLRVESDTMTAIRDNDRRRLETPIYEFVSGSYANEHRDLEVNTSFSLFADPTGNKGNQADLYIMDLRFEAVPKFLQLRVGRSFDTVNTTSAAPVDLIAGELSLLESKLKVGAFAGIERKFEKSTENPSANLIGTRAEYHTDDRLPLFMLGKVVQRSNHSAGHQIENLVQLAGHKAWDGDWSPEWTIDSVTNVTKSNLDRFEAGIDVYPSVSSFGQFRLLTVDVLPNTGVEQPIYSIFSVGRLYEGRLQYERRIKTDLIVSLSGFYDNYAIQTQKRTDGFGGEVEMRLLGDRGYQWSNATYFFVSYGGKVVGNRIGVTKTVARNNDLFARADVSYYEKITSSKRMAVSSEVGWVRAIGEKCQFTVSGQANTNNVLREDFRAFAKLTYLLWDEL